MKSYRKDIVSLKSIHDNLNQSMINVKLKVSLIGAVYFAGDIGDWGLEINTW